MSKLPRNRKASDAPGSDSQIHRPTASPLLLGSVVSFDTVVTVDAVCNVAAPWHTCHRPCCHIEFHLSNLVYEDACECTTHTQTQHARKVAISSTPDRENGR